MGNAEALFSTWADGAVVVIQSSDETIATRPAAFVFETADGIAWVEPSYVDPWGASSTAFHARAGTVEILGAGVRCIGERETITLLRYDPDEDRDLVGDALAMWAGYLAMSGLTFDEERARIRALCGV